MKLIPKHQKGKKVYLPQEEVTFVQPYTVQYQGRTYPVDDPDYPGAISIGRAPDATKVVARPYVSAMDDPLRRIVDPMLNGANKFLSTPMKTGPNGTASSAAAFSRYIPRTIDTTVGDELGYAAMNLGGPAIVSGLATRTVPTIFGLAGGVAGSEVGNELAGPAGGFLGAFLGGAGGYKMGERIPIRWGTPKTPAVKPVIKTLAEVDPTRAAEVRAKGFDPEKIPVVVDKDGNVTHVDYSNYTTEKPFMAGDGLSQAQIEKGWKKEKNVFISPKGDRFVRDKKTGRLISEASLKTRKDIEAQRKQVIEEQKALTPQGRVKAIYNQYKDAVLNSAKQTGINWSHTNIDNPGTIMSAVDDEFLLSPVGKDRQTPFLKRYYDNVMKVIKPGGFQDQLLRSGELRINPETNRWEGLVRGEYQYVRPTEYIKMRLAQSKGADVILPGKGVEGSTDYYPYHGTKDKDIKYLTRPSEVPGSSGYFTIINNGNTGSGNVRAKYQGKGYSFPFFMKEHVNVLPLRNVGNSNSVHGTGTFLRTIVEQNPDKIIDATGVIDGTYGGYNHEYNFGPGVKDVKSMINTLDFEPGAGPFAYSQNMSDERNFT